MHESPITIEELGRAIEHRMGTDAADAQKDAELLLDVFGFDTYIIDNVLEPPERQLLYALQSCGLFTTRSEVNTLENGHDWRTHYWIMREAEIRGASAAQEDAERARGAMREANPYEALPEGAWVRG